MALIKGTLGNDLLSGTSAGDLIVGFGGDDTLSGAAGNDWIFGGAGNDNLDGGAGNDWLVGGDGNDWMNAGAGVNAVDGGAGVNGLGFDAGGVSEGVRFEVVGDLENGGQLVATTASGVVLQRTTAWNVTKTAGGGGSGNDTIIGDSDDDAFWGNGGNDVLSSGHGADFLNGGAGNDTMTGGAGADRFWFGPTDGVDSITDFGFADGDRLQIAATTTYTVTSSTAGAVIDFGGGNGVTLAGVQASQVTSAWFVAG